MTLDLPTPEASALLTKQVPPENATPASVPDTNSLIDKADAVAARMEAANAKAEKLLERQEAIAARMLLSGRAEAGAVQKTPEQTAQEKVDADIAAGLKRFGLRK